MGAGQTAARTAGGAFWGAIEGAATAIFSSAIVGGVIGLAAGLMLAWAPLLVAGLAIGGLIAGGIFGFSVLAPLFSFIGGTWKAAKEARAGSKQSALEQQQQYEMKRQAMLEQRQAVYPPMLSDGSDYSGSGKSFVDAVEQQRANTSNNRTV